MSNFQTVPTGMLADPAGGSCSWFLYGVPEETDVLQPGLCQSGRGLPQSKTLRAGSTV